ncbi:MAG: hypothetical protein GY928_19605 [Colwellia sp.]|nr:hypothetical protein [Colwellia sp.]
MHFNRPRVPQENAKVERNQGTTARWSDYQKCNNYQQLQQALNNACLIQRDKYPLDRAGLKTRKELFPELYTNPNKFETNCFSMKRVIDTLAEHTYIRRVSKNNQFTLYGVQLSVPKGYAHQDIVIKLNAKSNSWQLLSSDGVEIANIHNNFITQNNINNLSIRKISIKT